MRVRNRALRLIPLGVLLVPMAWGCSESGFDRCVDELVPTDMGIIEIHDYCTIHEDEY